MVIVTVGWVAADPLVGVAALAGLLLLPYATAPTMPWGATGQLRAVQYPAGWVAVRQELQRAPGDSSILILPWHLYLKVDFARRVVADPAPKYFGMDDRRTISSADPELGGAAQARPSAATRQAEEAVRRALRSDGAGFAASLDALGAEYIILTKNTDFQRYGFLGRQAGLELVYDDEDISLYRHRGFDLGR